MSPRKENWTNRYSPEFAIQVFGVFLICIQSNLIAQELTESIPSGSVDLEFERSSFVTGRESIRTCKFNVTIEQKRESKIGLITRDAGWISRTTDSDLSVQIRWNLMERIWMTFACGEESSATRKNTSSGTTSESSGIRCREIWIISSQWAGLIFVASASSHSMTSPLEPKPPHNSR